MYRFECFHVTYSLTSSSSRESKIVPRTISVRFGLILPNWWQSQSRQSPFGMAKASPKNPGKHRSQDVCNEIEKQ